MMRLMRFRVTNFRSIMDSGWIECDDVTTLVGINESGKSNVILALWKLNPVRDGEIDILHDMPTREYSSWRTTPETIAFISVDLQLDDSQIEKIVSKCNCSKEVASIINVTRYYNGKFQITFPNFKELIEIDATSIHSLVESAKAELIKLNEKTKAEAGIKAKANELYHSILKYISARNTLGYNDIETVLEMYPVDIVQSATSEIYPQLHRVKNEIARMLTITKPINPSEEEDITGYILDEMPSFVYYSNYGNLDAQIYLPHAVKVLNGEKITGVDYSAKARTLRVLFDFVKLDPQEVLDLGKDPDELVRNSQGTMVKRDPTDEEIKDATNQKAARTRLLNSASSALTREFRDWWKQGNYIFRFQADGDFFKIWVSDDKRPDEIELERRSTGLQWFLSFFLVFLVESKEAHKGAILLLDEAGLSLHPLSQKDLIAFFENLAKTNQIIYTTHSPFLVDTSNIDRAKVVFSDDDGYTVTSSNLRASDDKLNEKSIYAVHAALGLSVSDILLYGCQPIIVEGPSDQHYFNAIKLYLIKNQLFSPNMELVFMPSGGVRGVAGVASIVSGKEDALPLVILDSDKSGMDARNKLSSKLYKDNPSFLITIGEFLDFDNGEVEDLIPPSILFRQVDRVFHDVDDEKFEDVYITEQAIVPQIETFAMKHGISLSIGWKVELAKGVKNQLSRSDPKMIPDDYISKWRALFNKFNTSE